jgi:hypothetical protein
MQTVTVKMTLEQALMVFDPFQRNPENPYLCTTGEAISAEGWVY